MYFSTIIRHLSIETFIMVLWQIVLVLQIGIAINSFSMLTFETVELNKRPVL